MEHNIFTVFDQKAKAYLPPFFLPRPEMALRVFTDCVNDPTHQFGKHPADYTLLQLGDYDDDTREVLTELAEQTGGRAFFLDGTEGVQAIYERILTDLRSGYLLSYQSTSTKPEGEYRAIAVQVEGRGLDVRARAGNVP